MSKTIPGWELVQEHIDQGRPIIGIDEVGRGCLAGPVVAAAVMLSPGLVIDGVNDSKKLSAPRRRSLNRQIRRQASSIGVGWASAHEIDQLGLTEALRQSGLRALAQLPPDALVVLDGHHNYLKSGHEVLTVIKGDGLVLPVAAASIIAKVARDGYMQRQAIAYAGYGFDKHVGYGTSLHLNALENLGITKLHRRSFAPVRKLA